ncbi:class I SAM-dependent methyltransferase [Streptomyces sp. NPDC050658]|uniref:class I SAM-dependent methyltransferase n=1 Tax=unclassified Streptomyces TaxID=2593676 RepID=UPI00343D6CBF
MNDSYAALAEHYDLIMTSGYYDYEGYARRLLSHLPPRAKVLELGVGTGLVCEHLLRSAPAGVRLTGIDHSPSMLARARPRLGRRVRLLEQDVTHLDLAGTFDVAYSVGGVWLWLGAGDHMRLGSHLLDDADNARGLRHLAQALRPGAALLLSVQEAHRPCERVLPGGFVYAQDVHEHGNGRITKDYEVRRGDTVVAHQRSTYRLFSRLEADRLLRQCGFEPYPADEENLFRRYLRT